MATGGPSSAPRPRIQGLTDVNVGNRMNAISTIMNRMQLTTTAIGAYETMNPGIDQYKLTALRYKSDQIYKALDKLSTNELQKLEALTPHYMQDLIHAPTSNYQFTLNRLSKLGAYSQIENTFIGEQTKGHILERPLREVADALRNMEEKPSNILQSLNLIKSNKDTGTGYKILNDFINSGMINRSKFFKTNMNYAALQNTYATSENGFDITSLTPITDAQQLRQRKLQFMQSPEFKALNPGEQFIVGGMLDEISDPAGIDEAQRLFSGGGGVNALQQGWEGIKTMQTLGKRRQLTLLETINRFNFNSTTRGRVHAIANLATGMSIGEIVPGNALVAIAIEAAKNAIKPAVATGLASTLTGASPITAAMSIMIPGGLPSLKTLSSVGMTSDFKTNLLNATRQLTSPAEVAKNTATMAMAGVSPKVIDAFQNMMGTGSLANYGTQFSMLEPSFIQNGMLGPNTNLNALAKTTARLTSSNSNLALATSNAGGLANNPFYVLAGGLMNGESPNSIYNNITSGNKAPSEYAMQLWDSISTGQDAGTQYLMAAGLNIQNPQAFVAQARSRNDKSLAQNAVKNALPDFVNKQGPDWYRGLTGLTSIRDIASTSNVNGDANPIQRLLGLTPENFGKQYALNIKDIQNYTDEQLANAMVDQAGMHGQVSDKNFAAIEKGIHEARTSGASSNTLGSSPSNALWIRNADNVNNSGIRRTN